MLFFGGEDVILTFEGEGARLKINLNYDAGRKVIQALNSIETLINKELIQLAKEYCEITGKDFYEFINDAIKFELYVALDRLREVDFLHDKAVELLSKLEKLEK